MNRWVMYLNLSGRTLTFFFSSVNPWIAFNSKGQKSYIHSLFKVKQQVLNKNIYVLCQSQFCPVRYYDYGRILLFKKRKFIIFIS